MSNIYAGHGLPGVNQAMSELSRLRAEHDQAIQALQAAAARLTALEGHVQQLVTQARSGTGMT